MPKAKRPMCYRCDKKRVRADSNFCSLKCAAFVGEGHVNESYYACDECVEWHEQGYDCELDRQQAMAEDMAEGLDEEEGGE